MIANALEGSKAITFVGGKTAGYIDLATQIADKLPLMIAIVVALSSAGLLADRPRRLDPDRQLRAALDVRDPLRALDGKWAWWMPRWMEKVVPRFCIEGEECFARRDAEAAAAGRFAAAAAPASD